MAGKRMLGNPKKIKSYQTMADLLLDFPDADEVSGYRRDLDLTTAISSVSYEVDGVTYTREAFVSEPDQVMVLHLTASKRGKISFIANFDRRDAKTTEGPGNRLILKGKLSLSYEAQLLPRVKGGKVSTEDGKLIVTDADEVTLFLNGATSYNHAQDLTGNETERCEKPLKTAWKKSYKQLREDHVASHQRLFNRVKLDLGMTDTMKMPTDERLQAIKKGSIDPQFESLYFQFGRYLLLRTCRVSGVKIIKLHGIVITILISISR